MRTLAICLVILPIGLPAFGQLPMTAQGPETATVAAAEQVLSDIMAIPVKGIPRSLLSHAQGIAIVPGMVKAGFVLGVRRGHGVLVCRDDRGAWQLPEFITVTGGSLGWQAGLQEIDLILVFRTRRSLKGITEGKFTVGADAAVAAGPVGRSAAAATDLRLKAEILSYSRSKGLFAGVALDGTGIEMDRARTVYYYRAPRRADSGPVPVPAEALKLVEQITLYSAPAARGEAPIRGEPTPADDPSAPLPTPIDPAQALRIQLRESASRLHELVDNQWKRYLALPAELYDGEHPPAAGALSSVVERYRAVAVNPRYRSLNQRPEFQATLALLQKYQAALTSQLSTPLPLPPPPE